jgi:hypothetical protein
MILGKPANCREAVSTMNDKGRYRSLKSTAREISCGNRSLALTGAALPLKEARMFQTLPEADIGTSTKFRRRI